MADAGRGGCEARDFGLQSAQPGRKNVMNDTSPHTKVSFGAVLLSVLSAMFGVQSGRNRERDFVHGKPIHYIFIGLIATLLFVLAVWGIVKLVLRLAGV